MEALYRMYVIDESLGPTATCYRPPLAIRFPFCRRRRLNVSGLPCMSGCQPHWLFSGRWTPIRWKRIGKEARHYSHQGNTCETFVLNLSLSCESEVYQPNKRHGGDYGSGAMLCAPRRKMRRKAQCITWINPNWTHIPSLPYQNQKNESSYAVL